MIVIMVLVSLLVVIVDCVDSTSFVVNMMSDQQFCRERICTSCDCQDNKPSLLGLTLYLFNFVSSCVVSHFSYYTKILC